ncbi:MAG: rhomboid family intramembrane serine protease [Chloroflexota bacterium]
MTQPQDAGADGQRIFDQAREAAERGEYDVASALYSRLVGNPDPNLHVAGLLGLADSRYRLDDEEGALQSWIVATQAPETPLTWRAWVALAGARVRQGDLAGAARAYREAERRAPPEEQSAIAARLGWLNKEMGNSGTATRYFARARGGFSPIVTWAILAITVAVSLWIEISPQGPALGDLLALDKGAVRAGEYWGLLTVTLVHGGLIHLLFNMYALYIVGPLVEALYGRVLFVSFYLLSAAGGSIASYLFIPGVSVGASGAIFGLFGLLFAATWVHKPLLGRQAMALTRQIGMLIVINLVIGFGIGGFASIDNAAHIGGLLFGAWLGLVVVPRGAATLRSLWQRVPENAKGFRERYPPAIAVAGIGILVVIVIGALQIRPLWA